MDNDVMNRNDIELTTKLLNEKCEQCRKSMSLANSCDKNCVFRKVNGNQKGNII